MNNKEVKQKIIENLLKSIDKKLNKWYNNNCQGELNMNIDNEVEVMVERLFPNFTVVVYELGIPVDELKKKLCEAIMAIEFDDED